MRASTMTSQDVLPFVPEAVWLSGGLGSRSLVSRERAPDHAPDRAPAR